MDSPAVMLMSPPLPPLPPTPVVEVPAPSSISSRSAEIAIDPAQPASAASTNGCGRISVSISRSWLTKSCGASWLPAPCDPTAASSDGDRHNLAPRPPAPNNASWVERLSSAAIAAAASPERPADPSQRPQPFDGIVGLHALAQVPHWTSVRCRRAPSTTQIGSVRHWSILAPGVA